MIRKIIWLIDENSSEIRGTSRALKKMLTDSVEITQICPPYSTKEEYNQLLLNPDTACIIIDERLKETGIATYTGIELANYLRSIDTKMPLYILTNFPDDFEKHSGRGLSVEDVLDKGNLSADNDDRKETAARILRRINVFDDILNEREQRFHALLVKSLTEDLNDEDLLELKNLQEARMSAVLADEISQLEALEQSLEMHNEILEKIKWKKNE